MKLSRVLFSLRGVVLLCALGCILAATVACGEEAPKPECQVTADCVKEKGPDYYCDKRRQICRKAACTADTDCNNGETCENGTCVSGGTGEGTTTNNEGNANNNNDGGTTNPPEGSTNNDTSGGSCTSDEDCGSQICQTNCTAETVPKCENGQCVPGSQPCKCATGFKCSQSTGQCESDVCPGNVPRNPDGSCPEEKCKNANCPSGQTPDPDNNCTCIAQKNWCEVCTKDAECGLNGKCVKDSAGNSFCAEDCSVSRSCSDNSKYSCLTLGQNKAVCMPVSGSCPCIGTTCPAGQQCCLSDGLCKECCGNSDCQAPNVCRGDGTCGSADKCSGVQCATGQQCNSSTGQCQCQSPCPNGTCCDPNSNTCTAQACGGSGGNCSPACQSGQQCCDVLGQKQCLPSCPGGTGGSCKVDSDCKSGEICCALFGNMCIQGDPILKLFCGGGGSGSCQSDNDCVDPSKPKCCKSAIPIIPNSCQAACP